MKKTPIIPLLLLFLTFACDPTEEATNKSGEKTTISLSFDQEGVTFSDEPFSRTLSDEDKTYLLIKVQDVTNGVIYAHGVFGDIPETLELKLFNEVSYEIEAIALKKGESYGIATDTDATGDHILTASGDAYITDSITYSNYNLPFVTTYRYYTTSDSSSFSSSPLPPIEVFYTSLVIDDSSSLPDVSDVTLVNNTFGIDATIEGDYSGSIRIKLNYNNSNPAFTQDIHHTEDSDFSTVRSFFIQDLSSDESFWTESYLLAITHLDTVDNIPLTNVLYNSYLPFMRLHNKKIIINAPSDTVSNGANGFSLTLEDIGMALGDTLIVN